MEKQTEKPPEKRFKCKIHGEIDQLHVSYFHVSGIGYGPLCAKCIGESYTARFRVKEIPQ